MVALATVNCIIIALNLQFFLLFQGHFCKLPLFRAIYNRKLGDYYASRSTWVHVCRHKGILFLHQEWCHTNYSFRTVRLRCGREERVEMHRQHAQRCLHALAHKPCGVAERNRKRSVASALPGTDKAEEECRDHFDLIVLAATTKSGPHTRAHTQNELSIDFLCFPWVMQ